MGVQSSVSTGIAWKSVSTKLWDSSCPQVYRLMQFQLVLVWFRHRWWLNTLTTSILSWLLFIVHNLHYFIFEPILYFAVKGDNRMHPVNVFVAPEFVQSLWSRKLEKKPRELESPPDSEERLGVNCDGCLRSFCIFPFPGPGILTNEDQERALITALLSMSPPTVVLLVLPTAKSQINFLLTPSYPKLFSLLYNTFQYKWSKLYSKLTEARDYLISFCI